MPVALWRDPQLHYKSMHGNSNYARIQSPRAWKTAQNMCYTMLILYYTILYYTILYYTMLILYYTILYNTILYYNILCYTMLYYTILYYTILC